MNTTECSISENRQHICEVNIKILEFENSQTIPSNKYDSVQKKSSQENIIKPVQGELKVLTIT